MRRIVRRTETIVTIQTRTMTWTEEVPPADPAPAALPGPAPDAATPEAPTEPPAPGSTPPGDAS